MEEKTARNNKIVSNSILYTISGLLIKCFSFFLLPLYTAFLSTEEYGITGLASSFLGTMSFVAAFSLYSAVMRFYVDLKDQEDKLKLFYGTIVIFTFFSSICLGLVLTVLKGFVSKYFFSGISFYPNILLCLISLVFQCQHTIFENILKSQQKSMQYSILSVAYFLVTISLTILFVVRFKMGATGVILATLLAGLIYSAYFITFMARTKQIVFRIDRNLLREALKYSIPIMPHNLSTQIATLLSMGLIGGQSSLSSLGIYTIASQFGNIADTVQGYVNQAYGPWLYEKLHSRETHFKEDIRETSKFLISAIGLLFLGISLFSREYIVLFVSEEYRSAWQYVPLIVFVYSIKIAYYFYVEVLFYHKKASRFLFIATLSSSLVNIVLSFVLIPVYGIYGSILADGISMFIRVFIVVALSRKFDKVGLNLQDFVFNLTYISLFILVGIYPAFKKGLNQFNLQIFLYEVLIVLVYIVFVSFINKKQIARIVKQKRAK